MSFSYFLNNAPTFLFGKVFIQHRKFKCESFAFETVMSHPSKLALLEKAGDAGFEITLVFISTKDPRYNVARVRDRVAKGGHDVPED